jgi:membrane dipeptidase
MRPSYFAALLPVIAVSLTAQGKPRPLSPDAALAHARELLSTTPLIDGHNDLPWTIRENKAAPRDVEAYDLRKHTPHQTDLARMRAGKVGGQFWSVYIPGEIRDSGYARVQLEQIDIARRMIAKYPEALVAASTEADVRAAFKAGKVGSLLGMEGGHAIENSLGALRDYYALGVRYMTLTWANSNGWADSSGDFNDPNIPHTKEGLSEFGKDVVYEMNRLGMMVDVSHVSDKTFFRTLIITRAPIIASHSGARALCDSPRNMTDDMLRAIANSGGPGSKGGVVQVNFYSGFVSQNYRDAQKAIAPEMEKAVQALNDKAKAEGRVASAAEVEKVQRSFADKIPRPPLSELIDHIDHIAKVAGVDHVGLGSDFDGVSSQLPQGIDSPADFPKITAALIDRGYSAEDCRKILGGNLLRVFREVEAVSKQLQEENRPRITVKQPFDKAPEK